MILPVCLMQSSTALYSDCYIALCYFEGFFFWRGWGGGDIPGRHTYPPFCPTTLCRTVMVPGRLEVVQTRYTLIIYKRKVTLR